MLKMQMDDLVVHRAGVLKDNRTDWGCPLPFPILLVTRLGSAQSVHSVGPTRIGPFALVEGRKRAAFRTRTIGGFHGR